MASIEDALKDLVAIDPNDTKVVKIDRWGSGKVDPRAAVAKQEDAPVKVVVPKLIEQGQKSIAEWNKTGDDSHWIKAMNIFTEAAKAAEDNATLKEINAMINQMNKEMELKQLLSK